MLSKTGAASVVLTALTACTLPWAREKRNEVNLAFAWRNNQIILEATLDGRPGEFIVGSAQPRMVVDRRFGLAASRARLVLGERFSTFVTPVVEDLSGIANGIIGADAWSERTLVIDYQRQMVTLSSDAGRPFNGALHRFEGPPTLPILLDGKRVLAIVDVALPDTLVIPARDTRKEKESRTRLRVSVGQHDFGLVDVGIADTAEIRIGNRLLSKFLLQIDYPRRTVSIWRDPRVA